MNIITVNKIFINLKIATLEFRLPDLKNITLSGFQGCFRFGTDQNAFLNLLRNPANAVPRFCDKLPGNNMLFVR